MNPNELICSYLYRNLMATDALLSTYLRLTQTSLQFLTSYYDSVVNIIKTTIDSVIRLIENSVRVFQKRLTDMLWSGYKNGDSILCSNLYKCNIFLEELTDENSLTFTSLRKLGLVNLETQNTIHNVISDYSQFKAQICTYGFTFNFGLSYIKSALMEFLGIVDSYLRMLEQKKVTLRSLIQKYINKLIDTGVFDLLTKLRKFASCVIEQTGVCGEIESSRKFYRDYLAKFHLEEDGTGGFKFESELSNKMFNFFNSRNDSLHKLRSDIKLGIDSLINSSEIVSATKAYSISTNIFPGGVSWSDVKKGNFKEHRVYKYYKANLELFINLFRGSLTEEESQRVPETTGMNFIINGMKINNKTGIMTLNINGVRREIDMENPQGYEGVFTVTTLSEPETVYINKEVLNDLDDVLVFENELMSALEGGIEVSKDKDSILGLHVKSVFASFKEGFVREDEVVTKW